jgi:hypothetical protein
MPPSLVGDHLDFLLKHRQYILSPDARATAFRSRFPGRTIIADTVRKLTTQGQDQAYSLIHIPARSVAVGEVVDFGFIPTDIAQMTEISPGHDVALRQIPDLDQKIVINISDLTKSTGDFADVTQFHNRVVRDALCRNYYRSTGSMWLTPPVIRFAAKIYSMTLGGQIARQFELSPLMQSFIQTIFCAFFVGKMTSVETAYPFLKIHGRQMGLPDAPELQIIRSFIEDIVHKPVPDSLEEVLQIIDAYDHTMLKTSKGGSRLTRPVLNAKFASLSPDTHVSIIALEYPPYFVYLLMLALSGVRMSLSFTIKTFRLEKEGKEVFEQIINTPSFLHDLG